MLNFKTILISSLLIVLSVSLKAQGDIRDSVQSIMGFSAIGAYELPGGDLADRFGGNGNVGGDFFYKTKKNFIFSLGGSFIFGNSIKDDSLFHLLKTHNNYIIDGDGMYADVRTYERGYTIMAKAGKIFNLMGDNPNSGLLLMIGGGFMQHKIRIENPGNTVPELKDNYKKGYDKLSNGPALSEYIGYVHYSDNKLYNFKIGFEFTQGFTQARRNYDLDLMGKDTKKRQDFLYGFKISWMIPLNKRKPAEFYYH